MISPKNALIFGICFFACTAAAQTLNYNIELNTNSAGDPKLTVKVTFYHGNYDTIYFAIPDRINQADNLHRNYRNWLVTGGRIVKRDSLFIAIKRTEKNAPTIQLQYDIFQTGTEEVVTRTNSAAPIIQPDYIHIRGYSLLLAPHHYKTFDVTVDWVNLPKDWTIQNSFAADSRTQHFLFNDRDTWRRTNWVAGDFRRYKAEVLGQPVHFAIRGDWYFDDTTLFNIILHTVGTQRTQWQDKDLPYYSVTLIPYKLPRKPGEWDANSLCLGNGLHQSFVTYADPECLLESFINLFNHEMMHEWIGQKINTGPPGNGNQIRWLSEGFTEYYALRNRWKAGFMTEQEFFDELNNDFFDEHYSSAYAELSNEEGERRRWESFELERIAYLRGFITAFYFDCAIRKRSNNQKTLFNCMLDLLEFTYGTGRDLNSGFDFFTETLGAYYNEDPEPWLKKHITLGQKIAPEDFELPEYIRLKTIKSGVPQFELVPKFKNGGTLFLKD